MNSSYSGVCTTSELTVRWAHGPFFRSFSFSRSASGVPGADDDMAAAWGTRASSNRRRAQGTDRRSWRTDGHPSLDATDDRAIGGWKGEKGRGAGGSRGSRGSASSASRSGSRKRGGARGGGDLSSVRARRGSSRGSWGRERRQAAFLGRNSRSHGKARRFRTMRGWREGRVASSRLLVGLALHRHAQSHPSQGVAQAHPNRASGALAPHPGVWASRPVTRGNPARESCAPEQQYRLESTVRRPHFDHLFMTLPHARIFK